MQEIHQWHRIQIERHYKQDLLLKACSEYVSECMDGSTSWTTVVDGFRTAFELLSKQTHQNTRQGVVLLSKFESELDTRRILFKRLLPDGVNDDRIEFAYNAAIRTYDEIAEILSHIRRSIPNAPKTDSIQNVLDMYRGQLAVLADSGFLHNPVMPFSIDVGKSRSTPRSINELDRYINILWAMTGFLNTDVSPEVARDTVIDLITQKPEANGSTDPLTVQWNGISMQDILYGNFTSAEILSETIHRYLAGMPAGDVYWDLMRQMFIVPPQVSESGKIQYPEIKWNILLFQKWLTEKLIMPAYYRTRIAGSFSESMLAAARPDIQFDKDMAEIVSSMTPYMARLFAKYAYIMIVRGPKLMSDLRPDIDTSQIADSHVLLELSLLINPEHAKSGLLIFSRALHGLLTSQWGRIQPAWAERFMHHAQFRDRWIGFIETLTEDAHRDMNAEQSATLNRFLHERMGEGFIAALFSHTEEIDRTISLIWQDLESVDYWPNPDVSHRIDFSLDSVAEILGLQSIVFTAGDRKRDPIGVNTTIPGGEFTITGYLLHNGAIQWNFDVNTVEPGVEQLLRYIASCAFRDLVKYGGIKDVKRSGNIVRTVSSDEEFDEQPDRPRKRRRRKAPRMKVRISESIPEVKLPESSVVIKEIEADAIRRNIRFTPRHVDPFKRFFRDLDAYRQAEYAYRIAGDDEKQGLFEELFKTRRQFRQPSLEKIEGMDRLPERFVPPKLLGLDGAELLDILPGREGRVLYQATWVKAFVSPKETDEERRDASIRYQKRYRQGSAMAFDGEIKNWIVGLDRANGEDTVE